MKQFIVLTAVIPIMLLFFAQFTLEQINTRKIEIITDTVYAAKETAKQKGGFDVKGLKSELAEKLGIDQDSIIVDAPAKGKVPRIKSNNSRGIIKYKVVVPLDNVIAGRSFLGIRDDTVYGYKIESAAPSEYIK